MKSELLKFLYQYKKEIAIAIIAASISLLVTKGLPAVLHLARDAGSYLLALFTGHRREYRFEKKYLSWLINQNKFIVNVPSQILSPERLPRQTELERAYMPLRLKRSSDAVVDFPVSQLVKPGSKTVILGDPGSGKTTQLRYFCLTYARLAMTPIFSVKMRKLLASRFQAARSQIPILLFLNRLANNDNILSAAEKLLPESLAAIYPQGYFQRLLESGRCIVLLDGLDELPTTNQRNEVAEAISSLSNAAHERNTWVVSSRIVGYNAQLHNSFEVVIVQPLNLVEVEQFVKNWYQIKCESTGFSAADLPRQLELHSQRAMRLINTLALNPGLSSLATSPILVSLIALLHSVKLELPQSRALLYHDCIELLADRWDLSRGLKMDTTNPIPVEQKILALTAIAFTMQNQRVREIKRADLALIIKSEFAKVFGSHNQILPGHIIDDLEERSGLLINRGVTEGGEKIMAFSHLSFQEYLGARSLLSGSDPDAKEMLSTHFSDSWWRESILLFVAQIDSPRGLIEQIYADSFHGTPVDRVLLAAACLSEVNEKKTDPLYRNVFSDVAYLYSGGEIQSFDLSRLQPDKNNMMLRHMVDYLLRTTPEQATALEILLNVRRQLEVRSDSVVQFIKKYETLTEVSDFDIRLINSISRYQPLPPEWAVAIMLRSISATINDGFLPSIDINNKQPATITLTNVDWQQILHKFPLLTSLKQVDLRSRMPSPTLTSDRWKQAKITALILKYQIRQEVTRTEEMRESTEENSDRFQKCLDKIRDKDNPTASEIYQTIDGWIDPQVMEQWSLKVSAVFGNSNEEGKALCIMLLMRFRVLSRSMATLLIEFIAHSLDSVNGIFAQPSRRREMSDEPRLQDLALIRRAPNSLASYHFGTLEDLKFLVQCLESPFPYLADFAAEKLEALREIDADALLYANELLESRQPLRIWAACQILCAQTPDVAFVERVLPQLYDKELFVRDKSISDVAAYSILRILGSVPQSPVPID